MFAKNKNDRYFLLGLSTVLSFPKYVPSLSLPKKLPKLVTQTPREILAKLKTQGYGKPISHRKIFSMDITNFKTPEKKEINIIRLADKDVKDNGPSNNIQSISTQKNSITSNNNYICTPTIAKPEFAKDQSIISYDGKTNDEQTEVPAFYNEEMSSIKGKEENNETGWSSAKFPDVENLRKGTDLKQELQEIPEFGVSVEKKRSKSFLEFLNDSASKKESINENKDNEKNDLKNNLQIISLETIEKQPIIEEKKPEEKKMTNMEKAKLRKLEYEKKQQENLKKNKLNEFKQKSKKETIVETIEPEIDSQIEKKLNFAELSSALDKKLENFDKKTLLNDQKESINPVIPLSNYRDNIKKQLNEDKFIQVSSGKKVNKNLADRIAMLEKQFSSKEEINEIKLEKKNDNIFENNNQLIMDRATLNKKIKKATKKDFAEI